MEDGSVMHIRIMVGVVALVLGTCAMASAQGPGQVEVGQKAFVEQKCAVCHSLAGQGNKNGPLDGVGSKLTPDEIRQWLVNAPEMAVKIKAERKPPMKAFGT
jgi:mono/diheme cytochrome c family protein